MFYQGNNKQLFNSIDALNDYIFWYFIFNPIFLYKNISPYSMSIDFINKKFNERFEAKKCYSSIIDKNKKLLVEKLTDEISLHNK